MCAGVGLGGKFRKVLESSGVCYCRFRRQVPESSGVRWCRYRRQGSEGSGELVTVWFVALQPCQGQPCDCFEHLLVITLSTWAEPLRKKHGAHAVKRGIRIMLLLLGIPPKLIFRFYMPQAAVAKYVFIFPSVQLWKCKVVSAVPELFLKISRYCNFNDSSTVSQTSKNPGERKGPAGIQLENASLSFCPGYFQSSDSSFFHLSNSKHTLGT